MESLSKEQQEIILKLVKEKNFGLLEFELENIVPKNKNPFLLNLFGVSKISQKSSNKKDAIEAQNLFKEAYIKDNKFKDALLNYSKISFKLLDNAEHVSNALAFLEEYKTRNGYDSKINLLIADANFYLSNANETILSLKEVIEKNDETALNRINFLYNIQYTNLIKQKEYIEYCKKFYEKIELFDKKSLNDFSFEKNPSKLRVGFFSGDLRNHSVARFLEGVLKELNLQSKFEIVAFNNNFEKFKDETTTKLKSFFDEWYELKDLKDLEAINLIRDKKISILFDMTGFSKGTRPVIFRNRSAPIQISWIGYCNTQGIKEIDYLIADENLIKKNEEDLYEERIIKLPKIWSTHSKIDLHIEVNELPAIKNGYITFGSFNNFIKISEETIELWCKILKENKNSKLILKSSTHDLTESLINKFKKQDVNIEKIIFLKREENKINHLKKYNLIDICLDTTPYTGVTTNIEAAWMGIPTITLEGDVFLYRCGASINRNINLNQFIAKDKKDYIYKANETSKNIIELSTLRQNLRKTLINSPVFDNKGLAESLSDILFKKWEQINVKK
jgi:protein O-GlcNAc transferase